MPAVDLPLEQLQHYNGTNPRPDDFDSYWDKALRELDEVEPRCELIPAEFSVPGAVECFDLYFPSVRGGRIHAKYLRPAGQAPAKRPVVLQFHGYGGSSGDWQDKLSFVAAGFALAAMDCRGQGGLSYDAGGVPGNTQQGHIIRGLDGNADDLLFRQIFLDCAQLARVLMRLPEIDASRMAATGGSQGGGLTLACGALVPEIKLLAPLYPFLCDYQRVWEMDLGTGAYAELRQYFRMFDPEHLREKEIFTRLGYIDVQHLASRVRGRTMMGTCLMDHTCPASTQFAAFHHLPGKKEHIIYPDFDHEGVPGWWDKVLTFFINNL